MTQTAVVTKVIGPGLCEVRVRRTAACGGSCASCGNVCPTPDVDALATNTAGAIAGDRVLIEGSRTLLLAALVYLAPLALFFIGWLFHPVAGAAGVLLGIAGVIAVNRFLQDRGGVSAKVIAVIRDPDGGFPESL
ncbi:MAG: SoxR reducing system RseC family protein [Oscillospiraceae bacterium]|nr:SoxR reducing system RseC family protein [Oscillospiraceae bacterium]